MTYTEELQTGIKVEREHRDTYMWLAEFVKKYGTLPPEGDFYKSIVKDHMRESSHYYSLLKKAGL